MGARPLQRLVRAELEDQLASLLLFGGLDKGGRIRASVESSDALHLTLTPEKE
jgi:ATP-dependent Clp protease ATP-binding subunit ClpA